MIFNRHMVFQVAPGQKDIETLSTVEHARVMKKRIEVSLKSHDLCFTLNVCICCVNLLT